MKQQELTSQFMMEPDEVVIDSLYLEDFIFIRDIINKTKVSMSQKEDYIKLFELREKIDNIIDACNLS